MTPLKKGQWGTVCCVHALRAHNTQYPFTLFAGYSQMEPKTDFLVGPIYTVLDCQVQGLAAGVGNAAGMGCRFSEQLICQLQQMSLDSILIIAVECRR